MIIINRFLGFFVSWYINFCGCILCQSHPGRRMVAGGNNGVYTLAKLKVKVIT